MTGIPIDAASQSRAVSAMLPGTRATRSPDNATDEFGSHHPGNACRADDDSVGRSGGNRLSVVRLLQRPSGRRHELRLRHLRAVPGDNQRHRRLVRTQPALSGSPATQAPPLTPLHRSRRPARAARPPSTRWSS